MIQKIVLRCVRLLLATGYLITVIPAEGQAIHGNIQNIDSVINASSMSIESRDWFSDFFDATPYPWQAPGEGDQRSPCAFLNTLANHGLINRNGTFIDLFDIATKMEEVFSFSPEFVYVTKILPAIDCEQTYEDEIGVLRLDLRGLFDPKCKNFRSVLVRSSNDITVVDRILLGDLLMTDGNTAVDTSADKGVNSSGEYSGWETNTDVLTLEQIAIFQSYRIVEVCNTTHKEQELLVPGSDFISVETLSLGLLGQNSNSTGVEKNRLFAFLVWEQLPYPFFRSTVPRNFFDANDPSYAFFLDLSFSLEDAMNSTCSAYKNNFTNVNTGAVGANEEDDFETEAFDDDFAMADDFASFDDFAFYEDSDDAVFSFDDAVFSFDDAVFSFDDAMFSFDDDDFRFEFDDDGPPDDGTFNLDDAVPIGDDVKWFDDDFFDSLDDQSNNDVSSFFPSPSTSDGPVSSVPSEESTTVPSFFPSLSTSDGPVSSVPSEELTTVSSFFPSPSTLGGPVSSVPSEESTTVSSFFPSPSTLGGPVSSVPSEELTTVSSFFPSPSTLGGPVSSVPSEESTTVSSFFPSRVTSNVPVPSFPPEEITLVPSFTSAPTETLTNRISTHPTTEVAPSISVPVANHTQVPSLSPSLPAINSRNPTVLSTNIPTEWPTTSISGTGIPSGASSQNIASYQPSSYPVGIVHEPSTASPTKRFPDTEFSTKSPIADQEDTSAPTDSHSRLTVESLTPVLTLVSIVPQTDPPTTDISPHNSEMPTANVELAPTETPTTTFSTYVPHTDFPTVAASLRPTALRTTDHPSLAATSSPPTKADSVALTETPITATPTTEFSTDVPSEISVIASTNKPTIRDKTHLTAVPHTDFPSESYTLIVTNKPTGIDIQTAQPTNVPFTDFPTKTVVFAPTDKPTIVEVIHPLPIPLTDFPTETPSFTNTDRLVITPATHQTNLPGTDLPVETTTLPYTNKPTMVHEAHPMKTTEVSTGGGGGKLAHQQVQHVIPPTYSPITRFHDRTDCE